MEKAVALTGGPPPVAGLLAYARARSGDRHAVPQLLQEYTGRNVTPVIVAFLYAIAGDKGRAFE